jgi:hypothetical protein
MNYCQEQRDEPQTQLFRRYFIRSPKEMLVYKEEGVCLGIIKGPYKNSVIPENDEFLVS